MQYLPVYYRLRVPRAEQGGFRMLDLIVIVVTIVTFLAFIGFTEGCERL